MSEAKGVDISEIIAKGLRHLRIEKEEELRKAFECARNGDPRAEEVLEEVYRKYKDLWRDKAGEPKNDYLYYFYTNMMDHWQEKVMELRCANNKRELRNLKSQVTDTVATVSRLTQQLEESKREMGSKLDLLLTVVRDLVEKQTEDNERMKQQLEDLASMNKELAAKQERLTEDNDSMKQQLEESNDHKDEMGCKLQLMLQVVKDLTEKQGHVIEENARMKREVEESNTQLKEISQKFKEISAGKKICEEDVRVKNPEETFTKKKGKESE